MKRFICSLLADLCAALACYLLGVNVWVGPLITSALFFTFLTLVLWAKDE